jgi:hypothetical protein
MDLDDRADRFRFLIRDRDSKFTAADIRIIRIPIRAPRANAITERFIGTLRRECLDRLLIWTTSPRHRSARVQHFNTHRAHRSLDQRPPTGGTPPCFGATIRVLRRDRLGGLIHEYVQDAPMDRQASRGRLIGRGGSNRRDGGRLGIEQGGIDLAGDVDIPRGEGVKLRRCAGSAGVGRRWTPGRAGRWSGSGAGSRGGG